MNPLTRAISHLVPAALVAAALHVAPVRADTAAQPDAGQPLAAGAPAQAPETVPPAAPAPEAQPMPPPETGLEKDGQGEGKEEEEVHGTPHPEPVEWDQHWFRLEMLYWKLRAGRVPPLVSTGPAGSGAILGAAGVSVLFPPAPINPTLLGARVTWGGWFNDRQNLGWEAVYFNTGSPRDATTFTGSGAVESSVLGRPFFNIVTGLPDALLVAAPGVQTGKVSAISNAQLDGASLTLLSNAKHWYRRRTDLELGPAYLHFGESMDVTQQSRILPGNPGAGSRFAIRDHFDADNRFLGGQLGARQRWQHGAFRVDLVGKVALGAMQETARVNGATAIIDPAGGVTRAAGGFLAVDSNSGTFERTRFAAVPQLNVSAAWEFTRRLRVVMGYNFLYASDVYRPGNLIDSVVNPSRAPISGGPPAGPARPAFRNRGDELAVQGLSLGFEWAY